MSILRFIRRLGNSGPSSVAQHLPQQLTSRLIPRSPKLLDLPKNLRRQKNLKSGERKVVLREKLRRKRNGARRTRLLTHSRPAPPDPMAASPFPTIWQTVRMAALRATLQMPTPSSIFQPRKRLGDAMWPSNC